MSLFVFNPFRASEELTPSQIRTDSVMSWFRVLLNPIKYARSRFKKYCEGVDYDDYDNAVTYAKGERVVWNDYAVYEARVSTTGVQPTGATLSATNWRKLANNFIGADERARHNGQLIIFEYAINRWFRNPSAPFIYVEPIIVGASNTIINIYVPLALYNSLGPNGTARSARVVEFAEKYTLAGWQIGVFTF